jgi:hypothetical protein
MTTTKKPETTHAERVAELIREGMDKRDAVAKTAEERSLAVTTVRAAYGRANPMQNGKTPKMPADPTEAAVEMFHAAIARIDEEIAGVQERANEALAELEALKASAGQRKAEYEAKIAALA